MRKTIKERKVNENDFQLVGKTLELVQFIILYKTFEFFQNNGSLNQ